MRVLLTWSDDNGESRAAIVESPANEDGADPSDVAETGWQRVENPHGDGIYTTITLPDDDFRPNVYDEYGTEVPMQFINL